ncbi:MAG: hypothetical protein ACP5JY_03175 [Candidatus Nanoarchaeia archaeon]
MAKAQGLPLSFIVIAAISALVLILVVAFTVGGLGGFFKQMKIVGGGEDLSAVQTKCTTNCQKLMADPTLTDTKFKSSAYCTEKFTVDLNKNGKIEDNEKNLYCHNTSINVTCTVQIGEVTYTEKQCPTYVGPKQAPTP